MKDQPGYDAWKTTQPDGDDQEFCTYPDCGCPFDRVGGKPCYKGLDYEEGDNGKTD